MSDQLFIVVRNEIYEGIVAIEAVYSDPDLAIEHAEKVNEKHDRLGCTRYELEVITTKLSTTIEEDFNE